MAIVLFDSFRGHFFYSKYCIFNEWQINDSRCPELVPFVLVSPVIFKVVPFHSPINVLFIVLPPLSFVLLLSSVTLRKPLFNSVVLWHEMFLVDLQTAKCSTLNCSFDCKLTPDGATCYCPPGQVTINSTQCTDYDECSIEEHICDQMCHNTFGSYECSCAPGYTRNNTRCHAINGKYLIKTLAAHTLINSIYLYWSGRGEGRGEEIGILLFIWETQGSSLFSYKHKFFKDKFNYQNRSYKLQKF